MMFLLVCYSNALADELTKARNAAISTGNTIRTTWTTKEAFANNVTKPITTGQTPVYTLDGTQSAFVKIACPSTSKLFEVLIQPGPTKDLNFIQVSMDSNLDGTLDLTQKYLGPISGICANGFVSCDAGTWNDCKWYEWNYDGTTLDAKPSSAGRLGGCFCINSGCTPGNIVQMKGQILETLGSGISGALSSKVPGFAATRTHIDGFLITFFGQNAGQCTTYDIASGMAGDPADAYDDPAMLETLTTSTQASQAADPDSTYNLLTGSIAYTNRTTNTCVMQRTAYYDSASCSVVQAETNHCDSLASNPECALKREVAYDLNGNPVVTYQNYSATGVTMLTTCKSFDPSTFGSADVNSCLSLGKVKTDGGCTIPYSCATTAFSGGEWLCSLPPSGANSCGDVFDYTICGQVDFSWNIPDDPCEKVTIDGAIIRDYCPGHSDSTTPDSGAMSHDSGSSAVRFYMTLNNTDVCNGWAGGSVVVHLVPDIPDEVCHDWWKVVRTYTCNTGTSTEPDISRANQVAESVTDQGASTWSYEDLGSVKTLKLETKSDSTCIKACKLVVEDKRSSANSRMTSRSYRHDPTSRLFIYRTCANDVCPVESGETIVTDCSCLDEFGLAYGMMETLRQAAADQVCSTK